MLKELFLVITQVIALVITLFVVCIGGALAWLMWDAPLPSEQFVRQQFVRQRSDYVALVLLLQKEKLVSGAHVGSDGTISYDEHSRAVPVYRELIDRIGAKYILVREDGSIEFALRGHGCTICSDSYIGVRYVPNVPNEAPYSGWTQQLVDSLESAKLPQEGGGVASGLYVVPIEPNWYVYRFEYRE